MARCPLPSRLARCLASRLAASVVPGLALIVASGLSTQVAAATVAEAGGAATTSPPRLELTVAPAWKGWTRPGRATEVDIRLSSDTALRASVDLRAGHHTQHAEIDLQPGRAVRLQWPVPPAERITVSAASPAVTAPPRELDLAKSESPLLGVGLAGDAAIRLAGFHTLALLPDDLPRHAQAYASIDALVLDAATLAALDQRQLAALLVHAAACGRIVLIQADERVKRVLDGAAGCAGQALMNAATPAQAGERLAASLNTSLPGRIERAGIGELAASVHPAWSRVAGALAAYLAALALVALLRPTLPALLLLPLLASAAVPGLLHTLRPRSQLSVWSEADSGARLAHYQAWQLFPGAVRERARVPLPAQLAMSVQACEPGPPTHFELDAGGAQAAFAEFDARLFSQNWLCYSGGFPVARTLHVQPVADGALRVRNAGKTGWPEGQLLAGGQVRVLPALAPEGQSTLAASAGQPRRDTLARAALARTRADGVAALWPLDLGGVVDASVQASGWLLVSVPP